MATHAYIAIEGPIGVGKTTLARVLGETLPAEVLMEVFEENPFLGDFYADRARYAFQTQIFFLLSRYRQQHRVIAETLRSGNLVSDYLFAKDWLFAHLNLAGDELRMYERVHAILGEQIPPPDLVIYLRASTETLMQRIASRDRSYERQMSRVYISDLSTAYEDFFAGFTTSPVLTLDTDHLDIVRDTAARAAVISRICDALQAHSYQLPLLEVAPAVQSGLNTNGRRLGDLQRRLKATTPESAGSPLYHDYMRLTGEIGQIGQALTSAWTKQKQWATQIGNRREAHDRAIAEISPVLQERLSTALTCLLKIATDADIDLESNYFRNSFPKESQQ